MGKLPQGPHPVAAVDNKGSRLLDLVVVDLAGPNRPQTLGRKLYDMVIVDSYSQRFFVVLLAKKSDAAAELMRWIPRVEVDVEWVMLSVAHVHFRPYPEMFGGILGSLESGLSPRFS